MISNTKHLLLPIILKYSRHRFFNQNYLYILDMYLVLFDDRCVLDEFTQYILVVIHFTSKVVIASFWIRMTNRLTYQASSTIIL